MARPATTSPGLEWPRLVAHELTHLAQIELVATNDGPAEWLMEGMAEWVAYRVLERLRLDDLRNRRAIARAAAVQYVDRAGGLNLEELATPRGFMAQHRRIGTLLTYRLVLHLADELVTRHGFESLVDYFSAFRHSHDAQANFGATFRTSPRAFARATLARLNPRAVNLSPKRPRVVSADGAAVPADLILGRFRGFEGGTGFAVSFQ